MNPVVEPFIGQPWLTYTDSEPSQRAVEVALPETLRRSREYPLMPGVVLDFIDDSTPEGLVREDHDVNGQNLYVYRNQSTPADEKRVVFYVHGGGFIRGNGPYCRAAGILHAQQLGLPCVVCEYRTAPEFRYPVLADDVYAAWRYLVGELGYDPADVIVSGDSAGGTLSGSLLHRLKRLGEPLPGRWILVSPALDFTRELPAHKLNAAIDPVFDQGLPAEAVAVWVDLDLVRDPEVSPYRGDLSGFPPTYFVSGEREILLSDTLETAAKLHAAGIRVQAHVWRGLWHDFITDDPEMPESLATFEEVRQFLAS
ncbi:MAG: alpha/beta hydrolase [Propionibacteriaceae bacterium]|jgi:acetyl esterase/lipase|nr:alpha/beta hydrolase [Propionibacteriaceae bacterium]